jgi:hypothetical protein
VNVTTSNLYYLQGVSYLYFTSLELNTVISNFLNDLRVTSDVISLSSIQLYNTAPIYTTNLFLSMYLHNYYSYIILSNSGYFLTTLKTATNYKLNYYVFYFLKKLFKINLFIFIVYTIFFITNFENYFKQQKTINHLVKLFILNASEKEVGPVDDYFFFAILLFLTITTFIFSTISLILLQTNILI